MTLTFRLYDCFRCDNDGLPIERMALVWDDKSRRRPDSDNTTIGEGICLMCGHDAEGGEAYGQF